MILINSSNMTIYLKDKFDVGNKIGGGSFGMHSYVIILYTIVNNYVKL